MSDGTVCRTRFEEALFRHRDVQKFSVERAVVVGRFSAAGAAVI